MLEKTLTHYMHENWMWQKLWNPRLCKFKTKCKKKGIFAINHETLDVDDDETKDLKIKMEISEKEVKDLRNSFKEMGESFKTVMKTVSDALKHKWTFWSKHFWVIECWGTIIIEYL